MNKEQVAKLILEGLTKERFRLWHGEGGRFERYITGEEKPDEAEILDDIVDLFKIPDDKETKMPQTAVEHNENACIDEICDTGIVLEDGRQLTFRDIGEILHQLARSIQELPPVTHLYGDAMKTFNHAGDILKEMGDVGEGIST